MVLLADLTDIPRMAAAIHDGWVHVAQNPENPYYTILCYSQKTQYMRHWEEDTTKLARGLVLELNQDGVKAYDQIEGRWEDADIADIIGILSNAQVAARSFKKFFSIDSNRSLIDDDEDIVVEKHAQLDNTAPVSVSDKLDGALGIGVIIDEDIQLCTKSAFNSLEARIGTEYLHDKHDGKAFATFMQRHFLDYTPLFEIISGEENHYVNYDDLQDVVFLGLVNNATGRWIPAACLADDQETAETKASDIPAIFNFLVPEVYRANILEEALQLPEISGREGLVVTVKHNDGTQDLYKIKYSFYLSYTHLRRTDASESMVLSIIRDQMTAADLMKHKPVSDFIEVDAQFRGDVGPLLKEVDKQAEKQYLSPIHELADEAMRLFCEIAKGHDLMTPEGIKVFSEAVQKLDASNDVKTVLYFLKGALALAALDKARTIVVKKRNQ